MKLPPNWNNIQPAGDGRRQLEPDAYLCQIFAVEIRNDKLVCDLDIVSGDFKDYFGKEYESRMERGGKAFWGLQHHVPINFDDPKNGAFFASLFKRFVCKLEATNKDFKLSEDFSIKTFENKRIVVLIYAVEKPYNGKIYQNYRVAKEFSLKDLGEGKIPESWIEDENGNRRKPNEPRPTPEPRNDDLEPVDDVDIPF